MMILPFRRFFGRDPISKRLYYYAFPKCWSWSVLLKSVSLYNPAECLLRWRQAEVSGFEIAKIWFCAIPALNQVFQPIGWEIDMRGLVRNDKRVGRKYVCDLLSKSLNNESVSIEFHTRWKSPKSSVSNLNYRLFWSSTFGLSQLGSPPRMLN